MRENKTQVEDIMIFREEEKASALLKMEEEEEEMAV